LGKFFELPSRYRTPSPEEYLMDAISKLLSSTTTSKNLRPFDPSRDLESVADLVELCFADTLDADGKNYIKRMRAAAKSANLLRVASMATEWASVPLSGYVWQEGDRPVGNITLIPYFVHGKRSYLIANVAVHPDYRRRGIARNLTISAIQHAKRKNVPVVWLHVRQENKAAEDLYNSMKFVERTRRTTWLYTKQNSDFKPLSGIKISHPSSRHWQTIRAWLLQNYPPEVSWHMPFNLNALRPGFLGGLSRLFYNIYLREWAVFTSGQLCGVAAWQSTSSYADMVWLALPESSDKEIVIALLWHTCQRSPSHKQLMLEFPVSGHDQVIQSAGFSPQQTLIWMSLSL